MIRTEIGCHGARYPIQTLFRGRWRVEFAFTAELASGRGVPECEFRADVMEQDVEQHRCEAPNSRDSA